MVLIVRTLSGSFFLYKSCLEVGITLLLSKPTFLDYQPDSSIAPFPQLQECSQYLSKRDITVIYLIFHSSSVCLNWTNYLYFPVQRKLHTVPNFIMNIVGNSSCPLFVLRMLAHRLDVNMCKLLFKVIDFTHLHV